MSIILDDNGSKEVAALTAKRHVVTAAEATAEVVAITLDDLPVVDWYIVQIFRAGVEMIDNDGAFTTSENILTFTEDAGAAGYVVTAGDIFMVLASGGN